MTLSHFVKHLFSNHAQRIAITYVVLAALWILFSDQFVAWLIEDPLILNQVQTLKGWFFVLFTGILLYSLMRRTFEQIEAVTLVDSLTGLPNRVAFNSELKKRSRTKSNSNDFI
ncbi:hypothetical protein, partial [Pseudoalteromonas sp.]|uniref:hypothetical protein n=1 Tax=Pseudoalteromonas sp. TaxID=53249 RepID=UPI003D152A04